MRIVTFTTAGGLPRAGALLGDKHVVDLAAAQRMFGDAADPSIFTDTTALFGAGPAGLDAARTLVDRAGERIGSEEHAAALAAINDVRLLAPVPRPRRLRDFLTFRGHALGTGVEMPPAFDVMPPCYKGNPDTVIGHEDEIFWPSYTDQLDYELEPAFIVGAGGRDIAAADAPRHIAGVTLFNDISARDIQVVEMSMMIGPSKSKDFCNVIGPCVATLDEIDEADLTLEARVNGEVWSAGNVRDREYSFAEVLAWASYGEEVFPGEVIAIGTVGGGCGLEHDRWIEPGDVIELEMAGVGVLRNTIGMKQVAPESAGLPTYTGAPRFTMAAVAAMTER